MHNINKLVIKLKNIDSSNHTLEQKERLVTLIESLQSDGLGRSPAAQTIQVLIALANVGNAIEIVIAPFIDEWKMEEATALYSGVRNNTWIR